MQVKTTEETVTEMAAKDTVTTTEMAAKETETTTDK
jgi:hypothetical protein